MKAIWSGTIRFGFVYIPIKVYPASTERRIDLNFIRKKDHCPIANVRVCKETGEEVPFDEIIRGYEYDPGAYIEVTDLDLQSAEQDNTDAIQIINFIPKNEIENKYFEKPYFVEPESDAKGYLLLHNALKQSQTMAIVRFVLKTQENLGVLYDEDDHLLLNQIRFHSQMRKPESSTTNAGDEINEEEQVTALQLVKELTTHFSPEKYTDTFNQRLKGIIRDKIQGKETAKKQARTEPTAPTQIETQLHKSLEFAEKGLLSF